MAYIDDLKKASDAKRLTDDTSSLTLRYIPYILRRVQRKYVKHYAIYKFDDLLEVAIEGALKAEKRFDRTKGVDFSTYAKYDIDGEMDNYIASNTKTQIALYRQILQFVEKYVANHSIYPSDKEIAKGIGITIEKYKALLMDMAPVITVSYMSVTDNGNEEELGVEESNEEGTIVTLDVLKLLETLDDETQLLIKLTCIDEVSVHQVATMLGITKPKAQSKVQIAKDKFKELLIQHGIGAQ
jgi:RNA polymerase sigma factor for flagellar operon FliA